VSSQRKKIRKSRKGRNLTWRLKKSTSGKSKKERNGQLKIGTTAFRNGNDEQEVEICGETGGEN